MTKIDEIMAELIEPALNSISVANGYLNDVSVLDGYLVHYANDLLDQNNEISFPCIAFENDEDIIKEQARHGKKGSLGRVMKIIGAVDATDRKEVNAKLNSLAFDVRRAASINWQEEKTKASGVDIGGCKYSLPKSQDQYAFFEMTITINYIEDWN